MVAHEPHDPGAEEPVEEIRAHLVVVRPRVGLADIVEQRRRQQHRILGLAERQAEHLERVEEGVSLGVVAGVLLDTIQVKQEGQEIIVHAQGAPPRRSGPVGL